MRQAATLIVLLVAGLPVRADVLPDAATLDFDGLGPLRIGMRLTEVDALDLGVEPDTGHLNDAERDACFEAGLQQIPGISLMFERGRLTRIDVHQGAVRTAEGLGIGSLETALLNRYGDSIATAPHFYSPPPHHYVKRFSPDGRRAMVFETDGTRVDQFRAGEKISTEYVEGCL